VPDGIQLGRPYPNPFHSSLAVSVTVSSATSLRIEILDILGRVQRVLFNDLALPGVRTLGWDGRGHDGMRCSPGLFFIRLQSQEGTNIRSILLQ
jgi:hypothetical protein